MLKRTTTPSAKRLVGLRCRGALGYVPESGGPAAEDQLLESLDLEGATVYDVGGDAGLFTLFAARRVGELGRVVTFEPNPRNFQTIADNVRLNGFTTVSLKQVAIGSLPGRATLVIAADQTVAVSLDRSTADRRPARRALTVNVQVDTLDRLVAAGLPPPDFIRIQVGGLERSVLEGMWGLLSSRHPRLYIGIHGDDGAWTVANANSIADLLWRAGYDLLHVESGVEVQSADQLPLASSGHLYCT